MDPAHGFDSKSGSYKMVGNPGFVDGFEGDKGESGARDVTGWRNAGLPWTYKIREGLRPGHNGPLSEQDG